MIKFPKFFIVGAAKAGTTSLYNYLKPHPEIYMSPIKEPNYFSKDIDTSKFTSFINKEVYIDLKSYFERLILEERDVAFIKNLEDYMKLFRNVKDEMIIGEASTSYLYSKVAAKEIKEKIPDAKIIIILRDPVERAFSHFLMDLRMGVQKNKNFTNAVFEDFNKIEKGWGITHLYIELGLYYRQVRRYIDIFPIENIKILLFDDFKNNTLERVKDILRFLGADSLVNIDTKRKYNVASIPKFQYLHNLLTKTGIKRSFTSLMSDKVSQNLKKFWTSNKSVFKLSKKDKEIFMSYFEDDIKKLSRIIRKNLSNWLKL
jgi:hypothetical protein